MPKHVHMEHGDHAEGEHLLPWTPVPRGSASAMLCIRKHTALARDRDVWPHDHVRVDAWIELSLDGGKTTYQRYGRNDMRGGRFTRPSKIEGEVSEVPIERIGFGNILFLGIRDGVPVEQTDEMMVRGGVTVRGGTLRSEVFFTIDSHVVTD